jgi:hypothetical protein
MFSISIAYSDKMDSPFLSGVLLPVRDIVVDILFLAKYCNSILSSYKKKGNSI